MVLRTVRWSDGRIAQFREDPVALALKWLEPALIVALPIIWWLTDSFSNYLLVLPLLALISGVTAKRRLRSTIRWIEENGGRPKYTGISLPGRYVEWCIRHYNLKNKKLLASAEKAAARGDDSAAAKYQKRASRCQKAIDKCYESKAKLVYDYGQSEG